MTDSTAITSMTLEEARDEVKKCDEEIQSIKAALRGIGSVNSSETNSLEIEFTDVEGLPDGANPTLILQLSSPIEERELTLGSAKVTFEGVETSVAMLSVDAKDADIPLGSSKNPIEVAPLCVLEDPKQPKDEYVRVRGVDIVASPSTDAKESETEGETETEKAEPVVCSVTLKVTFKPSSKDQREELYDLLNKTSQRKATALGELRKRSIEKARAGASAASESGKSTAVTRSKPSVKAGFLNKGGKKGDEEEDNKGLVSSVKKWYKRVTGPDSMVVKSAVFAMVTKDFWIFFGAVGLMHFRGNLLALPPPV